MKLNKKQIKEALEWWDSLVSGSTLPLWSELPEIELYMDQVINIIDRYLKAYSIEKSLTPSMINNYVKNGIIPPPCKKRYGKSHLAYLIIICFLKQTLSISTIQKIIPCNLKENRIKELYNSFVDNQTTAYRYVTDQIKNVADPITESATEETERTEDFFMQVSISANIFKHLTEKLTSLGGEE